MNDIVNMVAAKTGLSESMARKAVDVVITQLKNKLPQGIGSQLDNYLGDTSSNDPSASSKNTIGGVMSNLGMGKDK